MKLATRLISRTLAFAALLTLAAQTAMAQSILRYAFVPGGETRRLIVPNME